MIEHNIEDKIREKYKIVSLTSFVNIKKVLQLIETTI